ncbi:MAG: flavodoxin family protein [Deltaproteobacteria bacterium]|nr:flavodoxin family protein [Deltaproteobacteria bacterium]
MEKSDERVKIVVLNGTYRPNGTTTQLARSFMEGAKANGAEVDMMMLRDRTIGYCINCLKCYGFIGEGIAPCSLKDDMDDLIARIVEADGILFASPVHNGFVTGLMTAFWERLSWRVARPDGPFLNCMSIKTRINNKVRAVGAISSAGGMPSRLRKSCDDGTPWMKSNAPLMLHGQWIGDIYAGADLEHMPESRQDWHRIFFLRRLSAGQRQEAYTLGVRMAKAIQSGGLKPVTIDRMIHPALKWILKPIFTFSPPYRVSR